MDILKLKRLFLAALEEENQMEYKRQLHNFSISVLLTFLPILIFFIVPGMADKYFGLFSGSVMYISPDHFFSFSPSFILDLPYFLPPIIWAFAIWFSMKTRKEIGNFKSFFNFLVLILITLNGVFLVYSFWFLYFYFIH